MSTVGLHNTQHVYYSTVSIMASVGRAAEASLDDKYQMKVTFEFLVWSIKLPKACIASVPRILQNVGLVDGTMPT